MVATNHMGLLSTYNVLVQKDQDGHRVDRRYIHLLPRPYWNYNEIIEKSS